MSRKSSAEFSYKASHYTFGNLTPETEYIWLVLHGYGQLAEYFIKKFDVLDPNKHFIIAPQGLSTAYLKEFTGRVGANWMTRYDRELDIENNLNYLDAVFNKETNNFDIQSKRLIVLGFSQGAATASRWIAHTDLVISRFLVWGGNVAHDIEEHFYQKIRNCLHLFIGDNDEFITPDRLEMSLSMLKEKDIVPSLTKYEGEHKIYPEVLQTFVQNSL